MNTNYLTHRFPNIRSYVTREDCILPYVTYHDFFIPITDLPPGISFTLNPRPDAVPTAWIKKAIEGSAQTPTSEGIYFHLLHRGINISADDVIYDGKDVIISNGSAFNGATSYRLLLNQIAQKKISKDMPLSQALILSPKLELACQYKS